MVAHAHWYALYMIFTILLILWNSEQKNRILKKLFCFSSNFDKTTTSPSFIKIRWKTKSFINSPFFCSEFQSISRIVKIVHSTTCNQIITTRLQVCFRWDTSSASQLYSVFYTYIPDWCNHRIVIFPTFFVCSIFQACSKNASKVLVWVSNDQYMFFT